MTVDLATATHATFAAHVGTRFAIPLTEGVLELELHAVDELRPSPNAPRSPFALRFRSPGVTDHLPQRIYTLTHAALGTLELFLVPLGPGPSGMQYEAVFG